MPDILDILIVIFPKEIYQFVIIYGFVYFLLIFYGTKQWEKYSSFEKVVFSMLSGYVVWVFFVFPISFFMFTLNVFQRELAEIKYTDLYQYLYIFNYIFAYLITWRLLFSKEPLRDNKTFFNFTKYLIIAIIIIFFMADYLYLAAFLFSGYQEYLGYPMDSFLYLSAISIFYLIFLEIYGKKIISSKIRNDISITFINFKTQYFKYLTSKNEKRIRQIMAAIFIIVIIAVLFGGNYYLKTTIQPAEHEKKTRLEIPRIETWRYRDNLTGYFDIEQNYKITFGLIPWVKFRPNVSLVDEYGKPYYSEPNYYFSGEYIIINGSMWNTTNVTLVGKKREDNLSKIYKIEKKDLNESVQRWDIIFTTPYEFPIEIRQVAIERDKQYEFVNYTINNLLTDESEKIQLDQGVITFNYIVVWGKSVHADQSQSITLFFKKKS